MPLRPSTGFVGADPAVTTPRGFDIVPTLSTRRQWFPCGPLPARHLTWFSPGLFLLRSLPWLLTTAAGGGLEPAPASRFRGASPHRWHSCALQRLFQPSSCSWRTVVGVTNDRHAFIESFAKGGGFGSSIRPFGLEQPFHPIQCHIRQQWGCDSSLGRADVRRREEAEFDYSCFEPSAQRGSEYRQLGQ